MHRVGLLFIVLSIVLGMRPLVARAQSSAGTWELLPNSPDEGLRHEDIFFATRTTGWIVGFNGVFKTTDGGQTWNQQTIEQRAFRSTGFANQQVGWIGTLTRDHILYETRDGGRTWTDITGRISGPLPEGICGLWVVNDQVIYGVGRYNDPAHLIKSTDGGQTWTSKDMSAYAATLIDVYFFDEDTGIAVGGTSGSLTGNAVVLRTEDGGASWSVQHTSSQRNEWAWKISFPTPEVGYVSIESGFRAKVLKTTDAGLTWEEMPIPDNERLQAVGFVSEDLGWVGGRGVTAVTNNGGQTWAEAGFGEGLNRIRLLDDSLAYAIGTRAFLYRIDTATDRDAPADLPTAFRLEQNYPNPFNPSTTIAYTLDVPAPVTLTLYDLLGRPVKHLVDQPQGPGRHQVGWDGRDATGTRVPSGVYLYRLTVGTEAQTRLLLLLK